MNDTIEYCFLCGGLLEQRTVTKIQTSKEELIGVVENVPAWVCNQCGEKYFDGPILEKIEQLLDNRQPKRNLSVPAFEF
ncbi:MAG: type II toxin-antitoxin system MqsA family antitoxin [Ignavibacteriae bacterium]|nr:type II toxin-antitoxin system MqsA family antitoxin [Ignavibacteriota bacterium]